MEEKETEEAKMANESLMPTLFETRTSHGETCDLTTTVGNTHPHTRTHPYTPVHTGAYTPTHWHAHPT